MKKALSDVAPHIRLRNQYLYNALWFMDHFFGKKNVDRILKSQRSQLRENILRDLEPAPPARYYPLERVKNISTKEFRDYMWHGVPVILEGQALDWECCKKWTPDYIAAKYGNRSAALFEMSGKEVQEKKDLAYSSLAKVVDGMKAGTKDYASFNPVLQYDQQLRSYLNLAWLKEARGFPHVDTAYQFFMGGAGTHTNLHCAIISNIFVQVYGEKKWQLFSPQYSPVFEPEISRTPCFHSNLDVTKPDLQAYPGFNHVSGYEFTLKPGDVFYNPPFWWHHVTNVTDSIGIAFKWSNLFHILRSSLTKASLTMLATNPTVFQSLSITGSFTKILTHGRRNEA